MVKSKHLTPGSKIRGFLDENTLVPALIEMPHTLVLTIKVAGISDIEVTHEFGKIAKRGFYQQMKMVRHQNIGMKLNRINIERLGEDTKKGSTWEDGICQYQRFDPYHPYHPYQLGKRNN